MSAARERRWTGRTALFLLLSFFGVVFAVNGVFIYLATVSWTGLSTEDSYRKGIGYNQTIERAAAQQALGWRTSVSLDALDDNTHRLTVTLRDRSETPIDGQLVTATLRRPGAADGDIETVLKWIDSGRYAADLTETYDGQWDVRVEVARDRDLPYLIETRLWPN
jgi:nitrogen fixation protein FixH